MYALSCCHVAGECPLCEIKRAVTSFGIPGQVGSEGTIINSIMT